MSYLGAYETAAHDIVEQREGIPYKHVDPPVVVDGGVGRKVNTEGRGMMEGGEWWRDMMRGGMMGEERMRRNDGRE